MSVYCLHGATGTLGYVRASSEHHAISLWKRTYGIEPWYAVIVTKFAMALAV